MMSFEAILGLIISVVIGIPLSYWGIWHAKKTKDKHSLSLIHDQWISLLTTFKGKFETLKIDFKPLAAATNLYYYRGIIINTGTVDIDQSRMYSSLEISFPKTAKVNECKIVKKFPENLSISDSTKDDKIYFKWDLLKPKEHFSFECIVESTVPYNRYEFSNSIKIVQRIANLKEVNFIHASNITDISLLRFIWNNLGAIIAIAFFWIIGFFGTYLGVKTFIHPEVRVEHKIIHSIDKSDIALSSINNNRIVIHHNGLIDTVPLNEVGNNITLQPIVTLDNDKYLLTIISSIFLIFFTWAFISIIKDNIRDYKKIKLLSGIRHDSSNRILEV